MGRILTAIVEFFRSVFGLNKESKDVIAIKEKIKESKITLKEIEDEETDINDVIDRFNK